MAKIKYHYYLKDYVTTTTTTGQPTSTPLVEGSIVLVLDGSNKVLEHWIWDKGVWKGGALAGGGTAGVPVTVSDIPPTGTSIEGAIHLVTDDGTTNGTVISTFIYDKISDKWVELPKSETYTAGAGINITGNIISNTLVPPPIVIDNTITDPSTITDFGGTYIVPAGATGSWTGQDNNYATTTDSGATWTFTTPIVGDKRTITNGVNAGIVYEWDGTNWLAVGTASLDVDLGYVVAWQSNAAPPDYLLPLSGGTFNKADYQELIDAHAIYNFQFIASETATTFTLKNFNDSRVLRGNTGSAGVNGGSNTVTIAQNQLPNVNLTALSAGAHSHNVSVPYKTLDAPYGNGARTVWEYVTYINRTTSTDGAHTHIVPLNGGVTQATLNIEQAYTNVVWCVKAKPTGTAQNVTINQTITNTSAITGDIKTGIQSTDHNGWVKLDGRAKSTLTATQQAQATALGIGTNLPDATNTFLTQNGTTLGSVSGSNSRNIAQNQLPNINYTGAFKVAGGSGGIDGTSGVFTSVSVQNQAMQVTGGTSYSASFNLRLNGGVTQQALDITPKSLSVNTFIYLGD